MGVDPLLIDSTVDADHVTDDTFQYLTHLHLAINEGLIADFSQKTLQILGFVERGQVLSMHFKIPLRICDDEQSAQTDVCLLTRYQMTLLILQEDKMVLNSSQPEPQVIAQAIAAYQYNNARRTIEGFPTLDAMTIPCITMDGTRPTFYLVPVTQELGVAVHSGEYPQTLTRVVKCATSLGQDHPCSEGMESPAYRRLAFQHLVAFRDLVKGYWQTLHV